MLDIDQHLNFASRLLDLQPDPVFWFIPVAESSQIVDFNVKYCNQAASLILDNPINNVLGCGLLSSSAIDESSKTKIFDHCLEVWKLQQSQESTFFSSRFQKHLNVQSSIVDNGILTIIRDRTEVTLIKMEKDEQAKLLNDIIESSPYGISLYESVRNKKNEIIDFRLKLCNKKSAEITAFSIEDLHKYTVKELMLKRGHTKYFEICSNVVNTGHPSYLEFYAENRKQWVGFSIVRFGDGYLLNYIDISETKELEIKASKQSQTLKGILDASITGFLTMEAVRNSSGEPVDFIITMINAVGQRIVKIEEEAVGQSYLKLFPSSKENGLFDLHVQVLLSGEVVRKELFYQGEGIDGWYSTSITKFGENSVVQSFLDITDHINDKLKLENAVQQLEASNKNLEVVTYAASHDLKEPLRRISSYAQLVINQIPDNLIVQGHLEKIMKSAVRMRALVSSILDYSNLSKEDMFVDVNLNHVLDDVLHDLELQVKEKDARIKSKGLPIIKGVPVQLNQLLCNLISNSLKFCSQTPLIIISSKIVTSQLLPLQLPRDSKSFIEITVTDNGIGFEQEFSERIFTMFERLHSQKEYPGTGIGLAICKKIVENHKGFIAAKSELGKGTAFYIYLPG